MTARHKDVGTAPAVDDLAVALGSRYGTPSESPAPLAPQPGPPEGKTTRRSWLLPTNVVEAFTATVARIHHGSAGRIRKSDAQAALIRVALDHLDEVDRYLDSDGRYRHQDAEPPTG